MASLISSRLAPRGTSSYVFQAVVFGKAYWAVENTYSQPGLPSAKNRFSTTQSSCRRHSSEEPLSHTSHSLQQPNRIRTRQVGLTQRNLSSTPHFDASDIKIAGKHTQSLPAISPSILPWLSTRRAIKCSLTTYLEISQHQHFQNPAVSTLRLQGSTPKVCLLFLP